MSPWTMTVARDDLADASVADTDVPEAGPGEVVLRIDRVGVTANNVTYAALGESFRYWEFFPSADGRGVVPLWGFADVVSSDVDGVAVGSRFYGYYPSGTHLVVRPDRVSAAGFRDASEHRATLPSPYNNYAATSSDPAYDASQEDLTALYRPLFWTSYMFADWLVDTGLPNSKPGGADQVVMSSASSKTAYGTAYLLRDADVEVVGLTSPRNLDFTRSLGVYDAVVTYDDLGAVSTSDTVYADFTGDASLTARLHDRLGASLAATTVVGVTHQEIAPAGNLGDDGTSGFFAPTQMKKRIADWGIVDLNERFAAAWRAFATASADWVDVVTHSGSDGMLEVWAEVQSGRALPRDGHVWVR